MAQLQSTSITGTLTATSITATAGFSGNGANLTNVTASNIINFAADVASVTGAFDYQVFTASGTWNKPTSFTPKFVMVQCFGGGGGGGGGGSAVLATARHGGAGGSPCLKLFRRWQCAGK